MTPLLHSHINFGREGKYEADNYKVHRTFITMHETRKHRKEIITGMRRASVSNAA